jgi:error-prone DNA polymerase
MVAAARGLGLAAIAVTDRNTLAGIVRAHDTAREVDMRLIVGCRLDFVDAPSVLVYPSDRAAYGRLTTLLTLGKRRVEKGQCRLFRQDLIEHGDGLVVAALPYDWMLPDAEFAAHLTTLKDRFGTRLYLAAQHLFRGDDARRLALLGELADHLAIKLFATNDALYHVPARRPLQDVVTCIREKCTIAAAGSRLLANAERHLKTPAEMARLFRQRPDAIAHTLEIAERCRFSLEELRYEYPAEPVPDGMTPQQALEALTWEKVRERWEETPPDIVQRLTHELALIKQLDYAPYFLTVYDIVRFARSRDILCQGRGSAANSVVCFVLGITSVDPAKINVLFERFVSPERKEPPDIDVDFEHERREEVIQYIYEKYTRERAGLAATVISYRPRSAVRDVGKAMGLAPDTIERLAHTLWGWGREGIRADYVREAGLDPAEPTIMRTLALARALQGFPRHLSQHVGGFVITRGPLHESVPIENAAMEDRTVIEWDKDDLDSLGMLKIDVLALGMLTCIRKSFDLLARHKEQRFTLDSLPPEDPATYDMLCNADSVGVFQVESRAQMSMLPRLAPREFYDLVIEVAIVRPGPIQGDMVHPYLRRRAGLEQVTYPKPELEAVLAKTKGVPLFQEQAMRIAIVAAKFTASEANQLRRAMATFRHTGTIHTLEGRFIEGMVANGYARDFAERCFEQIKGFGEYGFPESHAASFALLVYASAWLKCHHPDVFAAAILNSQPMGFYAPAQLVRDAREHGVEIRPADVNRSDWDCTLEPRAGEPTDGRFHALRLGLRQIKGVGEKEGLALMQARARLGGAFVDVGQLQQESGLSARTLQALARGDAFGSLGQHRREALWAVRGLSATPAQPGKTLRAVQREPPARLKEAPLGEAVFEDYVQLGLSLRAHPMALIRRQLSAEGWIANRRLPEWRPETEIAVAGLVLVRQQPGTASGVIFMTLEDETGIANIVVWPTVFQRFRRVVLGAQAAGVRGPVQREGIVIHVVARELVDLTEPVRALAAADEHGPLLRSRDFH